MKMFLFVFLPAFTAVYLSRVMIPPILLVKYKRRLIGPVGSKGGWHRLEPKLNGVAFAPILCCLLIVTLVVVIKLVQLDLGVQSWAILPSFLMLLCGLGILFVVGIASDLGGAGYKWRFFAQILAAAFFPVSGLWINDCYGMGSIIAFPPWVGVPLTIFAVLLIINVIGLIDRLDGLYSGVVCLGCIVLGGLFAYYDAWLHTLFAFIIAGALVPFFYFNVVGITRRRPKILMGDTGGMTLGYSVAFLVISFAMNNQYIKPFSEGAIVIAFSVLMVPVFDLTRTVCIRWRTRRHLSMPEQNHLYYRFLHTGMSRHRAISLMQLLVLFLCLFNLYMVHRVSNTIVVTSDVAVWALFHWFFGRLEKRTSAAKS